jgi:DNA-directed RNA polymerase subunit RPC12/RpoP
MKSTCRHCGAENQLAEGANPDYACKVCGQWQDTIACPTCGQPTRISLMPPDLVPAPHAPEE